MADVLRMVTDIVSAHASSSQLSTEELVSEIQKVHAALTALETGVAVPTAEEEKPSLTIKQAFKKDEVICMICGKGGMKSLARHLAKSHDMKPGQYRKQFGISRSQSLTAKSFSDARKKAAEDRNLAANLAKAREVRMAKLKEKKAAPAKPAKKAKAAKKA